MSFVRALCLSSLVIGCKSSTTPAPTNEWIALDERIPGIEINVPAKSTVSGLAQNREAYINAPSTMEDGNGYALFINQHDEPASFDEVKAEIETREQRKSKAFTRQDRAADLWHLEYEQEGGTYQQFGLSIATTIAGKHYTCGTVDVSAKRLVQARAACQSMRAKASAAGAAVAKPTEAATGPKTVTADELFAARDALKGKQVVVTGTVKHVVGMGGYTVILPAGDKAIDLEFADGGAAGTARDLKAGDAITAECKVGGTSVDGNDLLTSGCVLR